VRITVTGDILVSPEPLSSPGADMSLESRASDRYLQQCISITSSAISLFMYLILGYILYSFSHPVAYHPVYCMSFENSTWFILSDH
jgi:hypothetical protein